MILDLPALEARIVKLAEQRRIHCRVTVETDDEEAARLAEMTPPSSVEDWKAALAVIGDHPRRETLIMVTGQMVMTGFTTAEHAAETALHIISNEREAGA
jgi:hypothetical protein